MNFTKKLSKHSFLVRSSIEKYDWDDLSDTPGLPCQCYSFLRGMEIFHINPLIKIASEVEFSVKSKKL